MIEKQFFWNRIIKLQYLRIIKKTLEYWFSINLRLTRLSLVLKHKDWYIDLIFRKNFKDTYLTAEYTLSSSGVHLYFPTFAFSTTDETDKTPGSPHGPNSLFWAFRKKSENKRKVLSEKFLIFFFGDSNHFTNMDSKKSFKSLILRASLFALLVSNCK